MAIPHLSIVPVPALKDNYVWTLADKEKNSALIVDPGDATPVRNYLQQQQLTPRAILITHHHWDHTNGLHELKKIYNIPVFGPSEKIKGVDFVMRDKDEASIEGFPLSLQVMTIPGHTLDHIAYYANGMVFCGDTLFAAGCGRLFEGTAEQMYASLQKLAHLPGATKLYCAHEYTLNNLRFAEIVEPNNKKIAEKMKYVISLRDKNQPTLPSSIAEEHETNPFLRCNSAEVIASVEAFSGKKLEDEVDVFAWLRKWKDGF